MIYVVALSTLFVLIVSLAAIYAWAFYRLHLRRLARDLSNQGFVLVFARRIPNGFRRGTVPYLVNYQEKNGGLFRTIGETSLHGPVLLGEIEKIGKVDNPDEWSPEMKEKWLYAFCDKIEDDP